MEIVETSLPGVLLIKPRVFQDPRGFFMETYRADALAALECMRRSCRTTIRAPHVAFCAACTTSCAIPRPSCAAWRQGEVLDIAVDIRVGSPNFGKWVGAVLSAENCHALYIPKGFAHGFVVRSETADFLYKCSDYYDAADDCGVLWNDPALGIDWDMSSPILSAKDQRHLPLAQIPRESLPVYQP